MAKTDKKKIMMLCDEINKKQGDGAIYTIDSEHANLKIDRWSTGIEDLDEIIGCGMPEGRTIEVYGAEGAGKTTLGYHLCGLHDICLYVPAEGTFDQSRAKIFGNRKGQMLIYRGACGEDNFNKIVQMARLGIPLIVIDSVPSMIPRDDIDKVIKSVNKNTIEEQRLGGTARLMEKYVPVLEDIIEQTGTTVVFIGQVRDKMDALPFGDKIRTTGGHRLLHSYSLRIQVARKGWIEIPNYNPKNTAKNERIGMVVKCRVVKSKVCNPLGECEIPLLFDRGFVSFSNLDTSRKEIMENKKEFYKREKKKELLVIDEWEGIDGEMESEGNEAEN